MLYYDRPQCISTLSRQKGFTQSIGILTWNVHKVHYSPWAINFWTHKTASGMLIWPGEIVFGAKENFTIRPKPGFGGAGTIVSQVQTPCKVVTYFQGTVESVISDPHGMGPSRGREVKNNQTSKNTLYK